MKILYTIADLQPGSGGPSRSVSALATAVASQGCGVEVMALEYDRAADAPMRPSGGDVRTTLVPCRNSLAKRFKFSRDFKSLLRARCRCGVPASRGPVVPLMLHDSGLWLPTNHAAAQVARATGVPFIVSPRGMLTAWALRFRGLKKRLAWHLYQQRDLQTASVLHATSHAEADGFRVLGLKQPIAIIPNGVELPPAPRPSNGREINGEGVSRPPSPSRVRTLLFLGRIHPVKGLLNLVSAWASARPKGWQVVLAGQNESNHQAVVEAAIREHQLQPDFEFIGPVDGPAKWDLYRSADLFVLPSHSENFGLAVAEALACGVPVITTRGTPWEDLEIHRCGWWVEIGTAPLANALREAMALTDGERREMGERGRGLVESKYAWPRIAKQMKAVYEWMLGVAFKPECISE